MKNRDVKSLMQNILKWFYVIMMFVILITIIFSIN